PDLKAQAISAQASELVLNFARNQARPDLTLVNNFGFSQDPSLFGFKTLPDSLAALFGSGTTSGHRVYVEKFIAPGTEKTGAPEAVFGTDSTGLPPPN